MISGIFLLLLGTMVEANFNDICRAMGGMVVDISRFDIMHGDHDISFNEQDEYEAFLELCGHLYNDGHYVCCSNLDFYNGLGNLTQELYEIDYLIDETQDYDFSQPFLPAKGRKISPKEGISTRKWGKDCKAGGGECKWNCPAGTQVPDDCTLWRKCCKKPPCDRNYWKCKFLKGGDCYQHSCSLMKDTYEVANGCSTNYGATCRCCAPCKKKLFQCMNGGRCTTSECYQDEVKLYGKCTDNTCHCCQRCTRKPFQCWGGRCTKEECDSHEVMSKGKCNHDDCHCCEPCKKKIFQCLNGRCTKEPCKSDETTIQGKCQHDDCHCCQKSCPDISCSAIGGRCRQNCQPSLFWIELPNGTCGNNCRCCKFEFPFLKAEQSPVEEG